MDTFDGESAETILGWDVSDDALEAAAAAEMRGVGRHVISKCSDREHSDHVAATVSRYSSPVDVRFFGRYWG